MKQNQGMVLQMRGGKEKCSKVEVSGIEEGKRRIPNWFGKAALLRKYWLEVDS